MEVCIKSQCSHILLILILPQLTPELFFIVIVPSKRLVIFLALFGIFVQQEMPQL